MAGDVSHSNSLALCSSKSQKFALWKIFKTIFAKSASVLKVVSTKWCSIISTSLYFITKFITRHMNQKSSSYYAAYQNPPTVLLIPNPQYFLPIIDGDEKPQPFLICSGDDKTYESLTAAYTLEFLPEERESTSVVASCNDLLFCRAYPNNNYYICNPFTMQWLLLPPPPVRQYDDGHSYGLVCAPNYQGWQQQQQRPYDFRFKAVRITRSLEQRNLFSVDVYCSETRRWNESLLMGAQYLDGSNVVAHDGRMHWYNGRYVVSYDPFNDDAQTIRIEEYEAPTIKKYGTYCTTSFCVGLCQGFLRFMKLVSYFDPDIADHLSVWELENYESKKLSLKHKIYFNNVQNSLVQRFAQDGLLSARALAFHPNKKDMVYVGLREHFLACKIQGDELQVVDKILYGSSSYHINQVFTTVLP